MNVSYFGKKGDVGIDVHKKKFAISAICEVVVVKKRRFAPISDSLMSFLSNQFPEAKIIADTKPDS